MNELKADAIATELGLSLDNVRRMPASELLAKGFVRHGQGRGRKYYRAGQAAAGADDKEKRKAKYEEARIRKLEIDTQLGTERLAEIKRAAKVEGAELVYEALRTGFGGYAALLELLENESKRKLKEAYEKCWDETRNALSMLLGN
jgi:hypothetical protein